MQGYDTEKFKTLLHDFYFLTGIKICIYDSAENEICYYPERLSAFCAALRRDGEMERRCTECDRNAFSVCKKTHRQHSYTCHMGLFECVSPVLYEDRIVGYIAVGQIRRDEEAGFSVVRAQLSEERAEQLKDSYEKLPLISREKIDAAVHILDACTGYEYLKTLVFSANNRLDARIGDYIERNIEEDLSVAKLCSEFCLSKTELYQLFREFFSDPVAEYIKKRRLEKACGLLQNTELPVHKVAKKCGIPDYNYFSKIFKKQYGMSPLGYRKKGPAAPSSQKAPEP